VLHFSPEALARDTDGCMSLVEEAIARRQKEA
jgi:hypothetical protein